MVVVALPFGRRRVDHTDGAAQPDCVQRFCGVAAEHRRNEELRPARLMEQFFDASVQRRPDELALSDSAPFTGRGHCTRIRRESDQTRIVTVALTYQLPQGDLAIGADFGGSRTYDEERGRFGIRGVIGPDEFHSGYPDAPYDGIDNNAYTNVMAVWVIMRAIDALNLLPLPNRLDLMEALGLNNAELAHWEQVSRRMYVPFHDGVISQIEGYGDLAELDWDRLRRQYGNIQRLDRILEAEQDDVNRYKASKQADALMLLYLLSATELRELLDRLGYRFTPEQVPEMVEYYLARTSHGSTLSGVVHSWVLARANRERAMEFFQQALTSDVSDIQGGTTSEGIHLAAMAGTVDLMQRCFTGLETRSNRIILSPHWPEALGVLAIPIHYRGLHLHLRVSGKSVIISVDPRDAAGIEVECHGRVVELMPGTTVRFPG
jgi:alpha,alpha-trehalase